VYEYKGFDVLQKKDAVLVPESIKTVPEAEL
jgi:hypothetical protein